MQPRAYLAFLALFLVPAAYAASLNDELGQRYKNQVLALRSPFVHGDQIFDSTGHPLNSSSSPWQLYGGILIRAVKLSSNTLELEGPRIALVDSKNENAGVIPLGKNIRVQIRLGAPLNSFDDARALLNRVFYLDANDLTHAVPEFRRVENNSEDEPLHHVGKDEVRPPVATYTPEPEFSEEARRAQFQGTLVLSIVLDKTGNVSRIRIVRPLGMGLDEQAAETVKTWRFKPATKDGEPVAIEMNIEVAFHLYQKYKGR